MKLTSLLTVVLVVAAVSVADAAATVTQFKTDASSTPWSGDGVDDLAFDASVGAGSLVCPIISLSASTRTISSVTDNGGNTYALASQGGTDATTEIGGVSEVWIYCSVTTTTMQTVTVTLNSSLGSPAAFSIVEIDGQHATPVEDVALATTTTVLTHTSGSVTTASAGSALIGAMYGSTGSYTIDADFTTLFNDTQGLGGYDEVGAGSFTMVNTSVSAESQAIVLIAIAPAAAPAASSGSRLLLGVGQ
jgi:hypothetical protein